MASALIQSNSQSALIATLNSASGASVNPFEYTLSKRVPSHGVQWTKLQPVNSGATTPGSVLNFDLTKMGFTRSLTLQWDVECARPVVADGSDGKFATSALGFLNAIQRIDIESSSRRILSMNKSAIVAAYSDLGHEQQKAFAKGLRMTKDHRYQFPAESRAANGTNPIRVRMPLLFSCFDNGNLSLATGFTEPVRVSITWAPNYNFFANTAPVASANADAINPNTTTFTSPVLIVEHRLLPNELEDATIAANYSQGPLSQLV